MLSEESSATARRRLRSPRALPAFPQHGPRERRADALVHAAGLAGGIAACLVLAVLSAEGADSRRLISLGLYAAGLMAMLTCSTLYNLSADGSRKALFQRLDHAAIFMMIAGTYTPFTLVSIGGALGTGLCAFVWAVAAMGMAVEILGLARSDSLLVAAYLLLGWVIVVALGPLAAVLSPAGMTLLVAGGVLYTVGVVFHLWTRLPYQNAIWHGFVLVAAFSHYAAILLEIAA